MISKLFIIQASIALIILASSLTSSVNAAAIAPARFSRQEYGPAALSAATSSTADNEKRFQFAHETNELSVRLPHLAPISERASVPMIADRPDSVSLNDSVLEARFNAACLLAFITCFFK